MSVANRSSLSGLKEIHYWNYENGSHISKSAELDPSVLRENFGELPLGDLVPTESGLSRFRVADAEQHLDKTGDVYRHIEPDGHTTYYLLNGHHRALAALKAGRSTLRVRFLPSIGLDDVESRRDNTENAGFKVPVRIQDLAIDPKRFDDYRGHGEATEAFRTYRQKLLAFGLNPDGLSDRRLLSVMAKVRSVQADPKKITTGEIQSLSRQLLADGWIPVEVTCLLGVDQGGRPPAQPGTLEVPASAY